VSAGSVKTNSLGGVVETGGPLVHLRPQVLDFLVVLNALLEVLDLLALLLLDLNLDLDLLVDEFLDLVHVFDAAAPSLHLAGPDPDTAGTQLTLIALDSVLVQGDVLQVADLLDFPAVHAELGLAVDQKEVGVGTAGGQLVAPLDELLTELDLGLTNVLDVFDEFGGLNLLKLHLQLTNLVVVGAALELGEDLHVNPLLDRLAELLGLLVVEDQTGSGTSE